MQFKNVQSFLKGVFEKKGEESRTADQFLTKLHNMDLSVTGKAIVRSGYNYWSELLNQSSVPSSFPEVEGGSGKPDTENKTGFGNRIQALFQYIDVAGTAYIVVVVDGRVYVETDTGSERQWSCLNPNKPFKNTETRMKTTSYLDLLFFNDVDDEVYLYDSQSYKDGGWTIQKNRFIYFAEDKIYFRNYSTFDEIADEEMQIASGSLYEAKDIYDSLTTISYPYKDDLKLGYTLRVGNEEVGIYYYVIDNARAQRANDEFAITGVNQGAKTFTIAGDQTSKIAANDKIRVDGSTNNDGIYNVVSSTLNGGNTDIVVTETIQDGTVDGEIWATFKCQIIKFNDRLIAQDYVEFDIEADADIMNFDYYRAPLVAPGDGHLFLFCKDGEIYQINETDLATVLLGNDVADLEAPAVPDTTTYDFDVMIKKYSLAADEKGMFIYSQKLPSKSDWYQPNFEGGQAMNTVNPQSFPDPYWTQPGTSNTFKILSPPHGLYASGVYSVAPFSIYSNQAEIAQHLIHQSCRHDLQGTTIYGVLTFVTGIYICGTGWHRKIKWVHINSGKLELKTGINWDNLRINPIDYLNEINNEYLGSQMILNQLWGVIGTGSYCSPQVEVQNHLHPLSLGFYHNQPAEYMESSPNGMTTRDNNSTSLFRNVVSEGAAPTWANYNGSYQVYFTYDKDFTWPTRGPIYSYGSYKLTRSDTAAYMLKGSSYDSNLFSDVQTPLYLLLVGVGYDGFLMKKDIVSYGGDIDWRYIIPTGKIADLDDVLPITYKNGFVVFAPHMQIGSHPYFASGGCGFAYRINVDTLYFGFEGIEWARDSKRKSRIQGDTRWLVKDNNAAANTFDVSQDWRVDNGVLPKTDYTDLESFNSNLLFFSKIEIQDEAGLNKTDRIVPIGTAKEPDTKLIGDNNSTLNTEYTYRYYAVYEFAAGGTTDISPGSEKIFIPNYGGGNNARIRLSGIDLQDAKGLDIYTPSQINKIQIYRGELGEDILQEEDNWTEPSLLVTFEKVTSPADIFYCDQRDAIPGGSQISKIFTVSGTAAQTKYLIGQKIEVVDSTGNNGIYTITNIAPGTPPTDTDITVAEAIPVATWDGDVTFERGVWDDFDGSIPYNPFTPANIVKHPVRDIITHKSRLVLINKTNEDNSNIIQYSEINIARSVSPTNIRPIESGDGDYLVAGESMNDYLYLFKSRKIYAILGDVEAGQLIDIDKKIGTKHRDLITSFNDAVYFMNDFGIYKVVGNKVETLVSERVKNYFDKQRSDSIDFTRLNEGFVDVDLENREIMWFVPQKRDGVPEPKNNLVIVYNIDYDYFKTREYAHNMINSAYVRNVGDDSYEYLLADYGGNIYKVTREANNDYNAPVRWIFRTKHFNMGSFTLNNIFKLIKVAGKYLSNIRITYWIDGERYPGDIFSRNGISGADQDALVKVWSRGRAKKIAVEVAGEDLNNPPTEIDEILVGFEKAGGLR